MAGTLYGVGVGPGDPDLLTLKAVRILNNCDIIAIPANDKNRCTAYLIAEKAVDFTNKKIISVAIPMTTEETRLNEAYTKGTLEIIAYLKEGRDVAFLNLGDPTVFGTYMTVHYMVSQRGFDTEIVNGITSFSAVAAKVSLPLGSRQGAIHIIPGYYSMNSDEDGLNENALVEYALKGDTLVFMKSASELLNIKLLLKRIREKVPTLTVKAVSNCCMMDEIIYNDIDEIEDECSYFTTIIAQKA